MNEEIKKLLTEQKEVWEAMKKEVANLETAGKNVQVEWNEKLQKMQDRLDQIETALKRLPAEPEKKEAAEVLEFKDHRGEVVRLEGKDLKYARLFASYLRKGAAQDEMEMKALASDNDAAGGYLIPRNVSNQIIRKLIEVSPVRAICSPVTISAGDSYEEPKEGTTDFVASWTGERSSRTETTAGTLALERTPTHELYANPFITQKMLDDAEFGFEAWLSERIGTAFALAEGTAFVEGSGVGQPEGLLTATVTAVNSGDANLLTADGLINLFYKLPTFYAKSGVWLLNRTSIQAIRKLKDSNNQYLWNPGFSGALATAVPESILGRPYVEVTDMPDVAANAHPIIFGDVNKAYRIVDRVGMRTIRDPFTNKPYVTFYTTKRVGGQVILAEAIVKQKVAA